MWLHLFNIILWFDNKEFIEICIFFNLARTTVAPKKVVANESDDEPLFDLDSGKNKKNDLLAQLFGEQAAKPDLDKKEKVKKQPSIS